MPKKPNEIQKMMGPLASYLVTTLYSHNRTVFHFYEAAAILGGRAPATKVLSQLIHNGIATRLKSGTFRLIPLEMGLDREYLGNPYIVARELVLNKDKKHVTQYYLSYGSAFDLHQMITQPQLIVYVSSPKMMRSQLIQGTNFHFVRCKKNDIFGLTEIWIDKNEKILISDLERTLLDGLRHPAYCGGMTEVAKAFSIKKNVINPDKLIEYAIQLNIGVVIRRLGYLMELYNIGSSLHWRFLQTKLTATYQLFDPELPAEGSHIAKWRLRLNMPEEELIAIRGT